MTSIIPIPNLPQTTSVNLFDVVVGVQSGTTVKMPLSQIAAATTAGVSSFNNRTGAVTLTTGDITGAGGAPIASPTFTGTVTIPAGAAITGYELTATANATFLPFTGGTLTGALTPSQTAGIVGTTTNNNANAGSVGQYISADNLTNVPVTNGIPTNIVSISLTAGDWDVQGNAQLNFSLGGSGTILSISTVSATFPVTTFLGLAAIFATDATQALIILATGAVRVSIASTTTVFLVGEAAFASGTAAAQGSISARRVR